jgi:hypothetical protein
MSSIAVAPFPSQGVRCCLLLEHYSSIQPRDHPFSLPPRYPRILGQLVHSLGIDLSSNCSCRGQYSTDTVFSPRSHTSQHGTQMYGMTLRCCLHQGELCGIIARGKPFHRTTPSGHAVLLHSCVVDNAGRIRTLPQQPETTTPCSIIRKRSKESTMRKQSCFLGTPALLAILLALCPAQLCDQHQSSGWLSLHSRRQTSSADKT